MNQVYPLQTTTMWQRIFLLSKVNGAPYEEQQVNLKWPWPEYTYLQRRLEYLRTDRTPVISQRQRATVKGLADAEVAEWISCDARLTTGGSMDNRICVNMPSDIWYWCADPMRKRL
jgi:hypothetical protein